MYMKAQLNFPKNFENFVWILSRKYNNKTVLVCHPVHQTSQGELVAARLTAQFYFYPVMSKLQNSINIYLRFWCRLACPTQIFRNL